jgi:hypothetical protein
LNIKQELAFIRATHGAFGVFTTWFGVQFPSPAKAVQ